VTCSVLVIDDHQVFADAIAELLSAEPDIDIVTTARTFPEAWALIKTLDLDVLVVDASVGDLDGIGQIAEATEGNNRVVVVGDTADAELAIAVMRAGALAFVVKNADVDELLTAVRRALRGELSLPPALVGEVISGLLESERHHDDAQELLARLTPREHEVLDLLSQGLGRAEIARELYTSINTVRSHMQGVFRKLGVHSAVEAISVALRAQHGQPLRSAAAPSGLRPR
jgi:DNA-binding NarL/FixJ family response regulator